MCPSIPGSAVSKRDKPIGAARTEQRLNEKASDEGYLPGIPDDMALHILACLSRSDYPILACLNNKYKSLIGSELLYKLRRQIGIVEQWIYLACIVMPWEAFDPKTRRWKRLPRIPCDECFTYADKESLAVGTELLVFGRELPGLVAWKYSLLSHEWTRNSPMNSPRCLFGSSSHKEIAVVAGGSDKEGNILNAAELYNSELGAWQVLANLNRARKLCSGFFMDNKFHVIGGMTASKESLNCGEVYDMARDEWTVIENMHPSPAPQGTEQAMRAPPLVAVVNNELYCADLATNMVKKYNRVENTWSEVKRLPLRADAANGWGVGFRGCGGRLLVIGGHGGCHGEMVVMHSWEPDSVDQNEWTVLAVRVGAGAFVYNCAVMGC
ncbi:F-box/kelch-repeat protein At5g60570-like [Humulus lupulus]|uniref:F-box/kelch-repeat protein At5g60570-like n=1 Tax=Humulus lupulus TaxID=3486 RepID=UPI002B40EE4A|nr:F-box/kelch-repeat protein At5g60570-like [Humulus lupulus]XP_062073494.1 F-box/kelch-repeat protein At5g60570-like [Humulus lupulus]